MSGEPCEWREESEVKVVEEGGLEFELVSVLLSDWCPAQGGDFALAVCERISAQRSREGRRRSAQRAELAAARRVPAKPAMRLRRPASRKAQKALRAPLTLPPFRPSWETGGSVASAESCPAT